MPEFIFPKPYRPRTHVPHPRPPRGSPAAPHQGPRNTMPLGRGRGMPQMRAILRTATPPIRPHKPVDPAVLFEQLLQTGLIQTKPFNLSFDYIMK